MYSAQCNCLTSKLNTWAQKEHSTQRVQALIKVRDEFEWIFHSQYSVRTHFNRYKSWFRVTDETYLTVLTAGCECINSTYTHTRTFLSSVPIWFMSMVTLSVFHTHEWLVKYSSTIIALCNRVIVFIILRRHRNNTRSEREKRRDA